MQGLMKAFGSLHVQSSLPQTHEEEHNEDTLMLMPSSKRAQERPALKVLNGIVVPSLVAAAGPPSLDGASVPEAAIHVTEPGDGHTFVANENVLTQTLLMTDAILNSRVSCVKEEDEVEDEERWAGNDIGSEVWNGSDRGEDIHEELMDSLRDKLMSGSAIKLEPGYKGTPAKLSSVEGPTLIIFDQAFEKYQTTKGCQECSQRVSCIMGPQGIIKTGDFDGLSFEEHAAPASIADILRVHDWEYVSELQRLCKNMAPDEFKCLDPPGHPQDTSLSHSSYSTAATAAGAVCKAVDRVMRGECKNAFVAARPPGHHAGPSGLVHTDDGRPSISQGFCLLNSVAIGAAYAKYNYRHLLTRIAIVDFDVHNGDGTAAIVRALRPHVTERRLGPLSKIASPCFKPWVDEDDASNVLFASLHLAAPSFYPRMACQDYYPANTEKNFELDSSGQSSDSDALYPNILNIPLFKTASKAESAALFRARVEEVLVPRLREFAPELIMISAGFDGHFEDIKGNNGFSHLVEEDYEWVTEQLCNVAEESAGGRVVSVLEGGYHVKAVPARSAPTPSSRCTRRQSTALPKAEAKALPAAPGALARSVAAHVKALAAASS